MLTSPLRRPLGRARARIGLSPSSLAFEKAAFSTELVLASGVAALDFDRSGRPAHLRWVGRLARPVADAPLPSWWTDLDGREVVHVTQGTQNIDPDDLLRPALEALADDDVLVVATTGVRGRTVLPFPVPSNARVADLIAHDVLLPRVSLMITNGGWGGTLAGLAHGIPLVIAGGDLDKPDVATRVAWTGAGVDLRTGTPTAAKVAAAVARVRADGSYRDAATRLAAQLEDAGGAAAAASHLSEWAAAVSA